MAEPITLPRWVENPPSDDPQRRKGGYRPVEATAADHADYLLPAGEEFAVSVEGEEVRTDRHGALGMLAAAIEDGADPAQSGGGDVLVLIDGNMFRVVKPWWDDVVVSVV